MSRANRVSPATSRTAAGHDPADPDSSPDSPDSSPDSPDGGNVDRGNLDRARVGPDNPDPNGPAAPRAARHAGAVRAGPARGDTAPSGDTPDPDGPEPPAAPRAARHAGAVRAGPARGDTAPSGDTPDPDGPEPPAAPRAARHAGAVRDNDLAPAPGAAPLRRMVAAQAVFDGRGLLRNGEQLLLTMIIPILLLTGFSEASVLNLGRGSRVDFLTPGIIALAVMSTAFASQAIATGFERRYGVLKRLGTTPLSRGGLVAAKTATVIGVELLQGVLILAVALG